jgi:uncharacterized protein involved in type VI secretion and phage assembly
MSYEHLDELVRRPPTEPMFGVVYASVEQITDDGYLLRYTSLDLDTLSAPARLAMPMAGRERGTFFGPEVGDEVVVAFENGNLDQPVILGALWSDDDPPPASADTSSTNNVRTIVSRSGHELTFDDTPGSEKIQLRTQGGLEIVLDDASGTITIRTTGAVGSSKLELDGVSWNHQHATGTGPSGPPVSINAAP